MKIIKATYDGRNLHPDEPLTLPPNTRATLTVHVEDPETAVDIDSALGVAPATKASSYSAGGTRKRCQIRLRHYRLTRAPLPGKRNTLVSRHGNPHDMATGRRSRHRRHAQTQPNTVHAAPLAAPWNGSCRNPLKQARLADGTTPSATQAQETLFGHPMDNDALELLPQVAPARPRSTEAVPPGLVFIGIQLTWERRVGDYGLITLLGEGWEDALTHWSVTSDSIHIGHTALGYCVDLKPGDARLELRVPDLTVGLAERHLSDLLRTLKERGRRQIAITTTAQFLHGDTRPFDEAVFAVSGKLFNHPFLESLGADLQDMSYLIDVEIGGRWFQIGAGVLSSDEVFHRIASDRFGDVPDVSLFVQVTTRWRVEAAEHQLRQNLDQLFGVAMSFAKELRS